MRSPPRDVARLTRIPGVGKKTSERMVVELRDIAARLMQELAARAVARARRSGRRPGRRRWSTSAIASPTPRRRRRRRCRRAGAGAAFPELLRTSLKKLSRA